jgi:hypothetical protein
MENLIFLAQLRSGSNYRHSDIERCGARLYKGPTARIGPATFCFLCTETVEKKALAHHLSKQQRILPQILER